MVIGKAMPPHRSTLLHHYVPLLFSEGAMFIMGNQVGAKHPDISAGWSRARKDTWMNTCVTYGGKPECGDSEGPAYGQSWELCGPAATQMRWEYKGEISTYIIT